LAVNKPSSYSAEPFQVLSSNLPDLLTLYVQAESREEKFVDVEQILAEARSLAKGDDLIFDAELEELMV
jgi:hypothetical protein